jgi:hypothetical protein
MLPNLSRTAAGAFDGASALEAHHQSQENHPSQSKISQVTDVLHRNLQKYLYCNENSIRIRPALGLPRGQSERDPQAPTGQLKEPHERDCDAFSS